jgi:ACS family tartrate transporter-like MFS transporter
MKSMLPTFWAIPPSFLTGTAAAGGIALINSVANIGGGLSPTITGWVKENLATYTPALLIIAAMLAAGGVLVLFARREPVAQQPQL